MTRKARFPVVARLDRTTPQEGTVVIDRAAGLFLVRAKRRRRVYTLPLADVATLVCQSICRAEAQEARSARRNARRKPCR